MQPQRPWTAAELTWLIAARLKPHFEAFMLHPRHHDQLRAHTSSVASVLRALSKSLGRGICGGIRADHADGEEARG